MYGRNSPEKASDESALILHHLLDDYLVAQDHDRISILSEATHETQPVTGFSAAVKKESTIVAPSSSLENRLRTSTTPWAYFIPFGWWWELGGVLVSITCTALTAAILFWMNGKSLDTWTLPIQPNSLVAIFSAFAKSALLVSIAECISQLKWMHFDDLRPKALSQLQVFDDASRGPWGSLMLFWKTRKSFNRKESPPVLALLGAAITILMLAFEPFAQQVIGFDTRSAVKAGFLGSIPASTSLLDSAADAILTGHEATLSFTLGVYGLLAGTPTVLINNAECPTDRCTIPDFKSLAACAVCESKEVDWDYLTQWGHCSYAVSLDGPKAHNVLNFLTLMEFENTVKKHTPGEGNQPQYSVDGYNVSCQLRNVNDYLLLNITERGVDISAMSALVGNYTVGNSFGRCAGNQEPVSCCAGQYKTKLYDSDYRAPAVHSITPFGCLESISDIKDTQNATKIQSFKAKISWCNLSFCEKKFNNTTIRNGTLHAEKVDQKLLMVVADSDKPNLPEYQLSDDYYNPDKDDEYTFGNKFGEWLDTTIRALNTEKNFAGSLMAFVDRSGWPDYFDILANVSSTLIQSRATPNISLIEGKAYGQESYVVVRWKWMIMPGSLVVLSVFLLICTAVGSAWKPYLFKGSLLAMLFHGIDGWDASELRVERQDGKKGRETNGEVLRMAEGMRGRLGRNGDGDMKILKGD